MMEEVKIEEQKEELRQGHVYKIFSSNTDKIYIGSTFQPLTCRLSEHRSCMKRYINGKSKTFITSFILLNYDDVRIELIETLECNCREDLAQREGYYIKKYADICVNKIIISRTKKEYAQEKKEYINKYHKKYRLENKDKIKEMTKQKIEKNNNIIYDKVRLNDIEINKAKTLERIKERRKERIDIIKQQKAESYNRCKAKIQQKDKAMRDLKILCVCGIETNKRYQSQHNKTKRHQKFITNNITLNITINDGGIANITTA
jgi:hypothetical protein